MQYTNICTKDEIVQVYKTNLCNLYMTVEQKIGQRSPHAL